MKLSTTFLVALSQITTARRVATIFNPPVAPRDLKESGQLAERNLASVVNGNKLISNVNRAGPNGPVVTELIILWTNSGGNAETKTVNPKAAATGNPPNIAAPAQGNAPPPAPNVNAAAVTHNVKVGGPGGLTFQPDTISGVNVGDTVVFEFLSQNHTVTQSAFETPCKEMPGGMDSGFQPNPNNTVQPAPQVAMQVMVTTPLWFYCRQAGHCGKGMTFSVNPTPEKTASGFQTNAIAQNGTGAETGITGGQAGAPAQNPGTVGSGTPTNVTTPSAGGGTPGGAAGRGGTGATPGTGTIGADGACQCVVACAAGSFPLQAQGVGAVGGMSGSLPLTGTANTSTSRNATR